jgi:hypothetical protein
MIVKINLVTDIKRVTEKACDLSECSLSLTENHYNSTTDLPFRGRLLVKCGQYGCLERVGTEHRNVGLS